MHADASSTSSSDWAYLSEGAESIVFAYVGALNEAFTGKVLRLRKTRLERLAEQKSPVPQDGSSNDSGSDKVVEEALEFNRRIISRLVPSDFQPDITSCLVNVELLSALARTSLSERPSKRVAQDTIDLRQRVAALATNLVGVARVSGDASSTLAIEIKPKWGFLPNPRYLSEDTREVKTTYSRFTMHEQYRVKSNDREASQLVKSAYEPLDLYSADEGRVRKAVEDLWEGWTNSDGEKNNFRIFLDGKVVKPNDLNQSGALQKLGLALATPSSPSSNEKPSIVKALLVARLVQALLQSPALRLLQRLQSSLDVLDIEGIHKLWSTYYTELPARGADPSTHEPMSSSSYVDLGACQSKPTINEWEAVLDEYFKRFPSQLSSSSPGDSDFENSEWTKVLERERSKTLPSTKEELRYQIVTYLLSATFKDCSLMIPFTSSPVSSSPDIFLIDLSVRSITKLKYWLELDRAIVLNYTAYIGSSRNREVEQSGSSAELRGLTP